jgi:hypothetical protein
MGKMDGLLDAIDKTPQQCLAAIKQMAIKDAVFNSEQIELFEDSNHIGKYVCLEDLEVNINQLAEQNNAI